MKPHLALSAAVLGLLPTSAMAQSRIVPDDTLGSERSQVAEDFGTFEGQPVDVIEGGAQRGQNLFHSFETFNVDEGRGAFFFSPANTENIFSRVTGGDPSEILGILGTFGEALPDLFFINPNGIIFGKNATLEVDGSFVATSADGVQLGQGIFSATQPQVPSALLTVDPSAFLFSQATPGNILNTAVAPLGLRVPNGHSLVLLGGNVTLDAGQAPEAGNGGVSALGGRVELGGVLGVGTVGLDIDGDIFFLTFPEMARANVLVANGAGVNAINISNENGGSITIQGNNVDISGESILLTGISANFENSDGQSGDVSIDATGGFTLTSGSSINNTVVGLGDSGDVAITASSVTITGDSNIVSAVLGEGDAGIISIAADETLTIAGRATGIASTVSSFDRSGFPTIPATGGEGEISLEADQIIVEGGALVSTTSFSGEADVGNIRLRATASIRLDGAETNLQSATSGQGNAGDIVVAAPIFEVLDGASLLTIADDDSMGDAGAIVITASDRVTVSGADPNGNPSVLLSRVNLSAMGDGGDIVVTADDVDILDGGQLVASTEGTGDAGNVTITAGGRVSFSGTSAGLSRSENPVFRSAAFSQVDERAVGAGGDIRITATTLEVLDGALLNASTLGDGDAGSIRIRADSVTFGGGSPNGLLSSATSAIGTRAAGQGGDIAITTNVLALLDGAQLAANTSGRGDAGRVALRASDRITIDGVAENGVSSGILTNAEGSASGAGGPIRIRTPTFRLSNSAVINARTENSEPGGNIDITADAISLTGGGQIATTTLANGQAGSITLEANQVTLSGRDLAFAARRDGFPTVIANEGNGQSGLFANTREDSTGPGGSLNVSANSLIISDGAIASAQSDGGGGAGTIVLNVAETLRLMGGSITTAARQSSGGDIIINAAPGSRDSLV